MTIITITEPNFYDLQLIDINMPAINGFELSEMILELDSNVSLFYVVRQYCLPVTPMLISLAAVKQ
jgi:CheY-like chemotaxis protein